MKQPPERLEQMVSSLEGLERNERIQMLVDIARRFQPVPPQIAQHPFPAEHRVPGCESEAYVWAKPVGDNSLKYYFAVENPQGISAMALSAMLDKTLSGAPLDEIVAVPSDVVYRIFGRELSMGKSLGLMNIVNMVKAAALRQMQAGEVELRK